MAVDCVACGNFFQVDQVCAEIECRRYDVWVWEWQIAVGCESLCSDTDSVDCPNVIYGVV